METASDDETEQLLQFVHQWNIIHIAAAKAIEPKNAGLDIQVVEYRSNAEDSHPVVYAVVASTDPAKGQLQIFLIGRDNEGNPVGLIAAPLIEGLIQQASPDGKYVEYVDPASREVLLFADGHRPDTTIKGEEVLHSRLTELYRKFHPYVKADLYPRFFMPIADVEASFYRIETSLTYFQILRIHEAFALFERPELLPLKAAFFGRDTQVILTEDLGTALGMTYRDSSLIELDRRQLFGNRYDLAEVLAHEGAHVIQGWEGGNVCETAFRMEIGDRTIPKDLFDWPAEKLIENIRSAKIGAYHVSMWIFNKLNRLGDTRSFWIGLIGTGRINGQSVVPACEPE